MKSRPVTSNTNAPSEAMSKNLYKIFNSLPPPERKAVKNGMEFANLVNGVEVRRTEEMGSYDLSSLYFVHIGPIDGMANQSWCPETIS